jgi:SAM-dependent methyltransferase
MGDRPALSWEWYGAHDPYYAIISHPKFKKSILRAEHLAGFFSAGQQHWKWVLAAVESIGGSPSPRRALDFGCGVGRILVAMAASCGEVVGVDVSESMLAEARKNCSAQGLTNVEFVISKNSSLEVDGKFDLVHSCIVFQHVPPRDGYSLVNQLLSKLSDGGVAALQFPLINSEPGLLRAVHSLRQRSRAINYVLHRLKRNETYPIMQMNTYSLTRLFMAAQEAGYEMLVKRLDSGTYFPGVMAFFRRDRLHRYPAFDY